MSVTHSGQSTSSSWERTLEVVAGLGLLTLVAGFVIGLGRGPHRVGLVWAVTTSALTLLLAVTGFWLNERGGVRWLLLGPLTLIGAGVVGMSVFGMGYAVATPIRQRHALRSCDAMPLATCLSLIVVLWGMYQLAPMLTRLSDDAMITNFQRHEAEFQRLAMMAEDDGSLMQITATRMTPPGQLSPERWDEYRTLFEATGVEGGVSTRGGQVNFSYWTAGLILGGAAKRYLYSTIPPSPLVESLDRIPHHIDAVGFVYRQIADHWYLVYVTYD